MDQAALLDADARRRRREPTRLAVARAAARGRRAFEQEPEVAERARAAMAPFAVGANRLDALARAHVSETEVREELIWRPWSLDGSPIHGPVQAVRAGLAARRGVLVTYCHFGPFPAMARALRPLGVPVATVGGSWMFHAPGDDATGLRHARWVRTVRDAGLELLDAAGAFEPVCERLAAGRVVVIAFDTRGPVPTRLLGMETTLTSGPARMAHATGSLLVPAMRAVRRAQPYTRLGAPLDTREYADWIEVHRAAARVHDGWMAARPFAHEQPLRLLAPARSSSEVGSPL